jgi:Mg2+/Co2+ transporter CorB
MWGQASIFVACVLGSAFFSSTETALMSVNRYRIRHLASQGVRGAILVEFLYTRTDELIALILMGNTLCNVIAASIVTIATLELGYPHWLAFTEAATTLVLLLFAEVAPKTWAVVHAEAIALPAAFIYRPLMWLCAPLVIPLTWLTRAWLGLLGTQTSVTESPHSRLSTHELRTIVTEATSLIPLSHRQMMTGILDLEQVSVEDIMIPRGEIVGIDLDWDSDRILSLLRQAPPSHLPVYREDINNLLGVVHLRDITAHLLKEPIDSATLARLAHTRKPYYVPKGTSLMSQLQNFQQGRRQHAYVVDEYGDLLGLLTLEAILEEVVGEFAQNEAGQLKRFKNDSDGSLILPGSTLLRQLARRSNFQLLAREARTINGLVFEHLENIPSVGTTIKINDVILEILQVQDHRVKSVRLRPVTGLRHHATR